MVAVVQIIDETTTGKELHKTRLELVSERLTVRELIIRRITHEVESYNSDLETGVFQGLIRPSAAEETLNGFKLRKRKSVSLDAQIDAALKAFMSNGFFMLLDDRQLEELDEEIIIGNTTTVSFIKLIPLVGG